MKERIIKVLEVFAYIITATAGMKVGKYLLITFDKSVFTLILLVLVLLCIIVILFFLASEYMDPIDKNIKNKKKVKK